MAELLLELLSEEIPARMQARAADDLRRLVTDHMTQAGLEHGSAHSLFGPRRLALSVRDVAAGTETVVSERKGPRVDAPQKAIDGFLGSAGVTLDQCEIVEDKKGKFYLARVEQPGRRAAEVIAEAVTTAIRTFPWPKSMRWGAGSLRWVRPLHSILCCLDGKIVPFEIDGIKSGRSTRGHRFMAPDPVVATDLDGYIETLRQARVVADARLRAETIRDQAKDLARSDKLEVIADPGLLEETAGLVEWPVVLMGAFDEAYLDVPPEVIVTSIRAHQKCFALNHMSGRRKGQLANRYLMVSNIVARDNGEQIVKGNNRVIAARLADARFFWDQDRKHKLEDRLPELEQIVFHARLGNQRQRVERLVRLSENIADRINAQVKEAKQAARLCKIDLVTGMVGEFPELQGLMGSYYARAEGVPEQVAGAIREHYRPQGPSDAVPDGRVAMAVALADKIDTLAGFWAIGETPTGSKDPYALRRCALGVIRIVLEGILRLPLRTVIAAALKQIDVQGKDRPDDTEVIDSLMSFFADRLKVYLRDRDQRHDLIDAVFELGDQDDLLMISRRVEALNGFLETDDGANLLAGVKRAGNILRIEERKEAGKSATGRADFSGKVVVNLLVQGEEKDLHRAIEAAEANATKAVGEEDFAGAMRALAKLRKPVDAFFDEVTVNAEDPTFRENRLKLLKRIRSATRTVADFSRIEG